MKQTLKEHNYYLLLFFYIVSLKNPICMHCIIDHFHLAGSCYRRSVKLDIFLFTPLLNLTTLCDFIGGEPYDP